MRLAPFLAFGLLLIAAPALAQNKPVYGSYTCPQQVPCQDDGSVSSTQWAAIGNNCIRQGFGYTNSSSFVDDVAGLNGAKCLTGIQGSLPNKQLTPNCCVIEVSPNMCALHCELAAH